MADQNVTDPITNVLNENGEIKEPKPETGKETADIETKVTTVEEDKPLNIDTSALKEEVTKQVTEEIIEKITGKKEEDLTDQSPWDKEKRNPKSYNEIADWSKQQALKEFSKQRDAETTRQEESATKLKEDQERINQAWNQHWDKQIKELVDDGELPEIKDKNDPNDPGVIATTELFQLAFNQGKTDLEAVYYRNKVKGKKQPAGDNAPVSAGKKSVQSESKQYSWEQIHSAKSLHDIVEEE